MLTNAGTLDDAGAGGLSITETATVRWLNVEEIIDLLTPGSGAGSQQQLPLSTAPPDSPPTSGTLLLYDRNAVRNYKVDGHSWIRKRSNPKKVREDHVKLRFRGQFRVGGTYVHSATTPTTHRRAYRLIQDPSDADAAANTDLVLVHYLDTLEADRVSSLYADHLVAAASKARRYWRSGKGGTKKQQSGASSRSTAASTSIGSAHGIADNEYSNGDGYDSPDARPDYVDVAVGQPKTGASGLHHDRGESGLDGAVLDILWDMIIEEDDGDGTGGQTENDCIHEAAAAAVGEHLSPGMEAQLASTVEEALSDVASSRMGGLSAERERVMTDVSDDDIRNAVDQVLDEKPGVLGDIEERVVAALEDGMDDGLQEKLVETMKSQLDGGGAYQDEGGSGDVKMAGSYTQEMPPLPASKEEWEVPMTPLPEIIDFTPDEAFTHRNGEKPVQIVISASAPIPLLPPDEPPYRWHVIAAFIDIGRTAEFASASEAAGDSPQSSTHSSAASSPEPTLPFSPDPLIMKVALAKDGSMITPFSYKCTLPDSISKAGYRSIVLAGVRYIDDDEAGGPIWDAIGVAVKVCIQAEWNVASDHTSANDKETIDAAGLVRPKFYAPAGSGNVQLLTQLSREMFRIVEVPAVDALPGQVGQKAMSDDAKPSETRSTSSHSPSRGSSNKGIPAPAATIASVAAALTQFPEEPPEKALGGGGEKFPTLSSQQRGHKRALSVDERGLVRDANESAEHWVESVVDSDGATRGEAVDRHCKIRFVERLANVIVGTEEATGGADGSDGGAAPSKEGGYTDPKLLLTGDRKLDKIDDDELDTLLQSVLIRFVESMVDSSTSEEELKEALNTPGFSGFTLLHYAALYNIPTLVPLLLSRGSDPDRSTLKGNLTPLHLAAGAGHDQIVASLVRAGSRTDTKDSFGLTPADHALRSGFNEIGEWLDDKSRGMDGIKTPPVSEQRSTLNEDKEAMMQSAFKELSLKDKLGLTLFVNRNKDGSGDETDSQGAIMMTDNDATENQSTDEDDFNFISSQDREALKVAMSMMSKDELEELEKNAPYSNVRDWMARSNYESLKEASLHLEKQAKRKALTTRGAKSGDEESACSNSSKSGSSRRRSNHSKLSQVLAMLVLRKNLIGRGEGENKQSKELQKQQDQQQQGGEDMDATE